MLASATYRPMLAWLHRLIVTGMVLTFLTSSGVLASDLKSTQSLDGDSSIVVEITSERQWIEGGSADPYTQARSHAWSELCLWLEPSASVPIVASAFDLRLCYDSDVLFMVQVLPGSDLHAEWEYFTYRLGSSESHCVSCPSAYVRVFGIANMIDGVTPDPGAYQLSGCIASFRIVTSPDFRYDGQCRPIDVCSFDCGDNTVASVTGDTIWSVRSGGLAGDSYDSAACGQSLSVDHAVIPVFDAVHSAVCIRQPPADYPDDLNLNGIIYEIGDLVFFMDYFLYGSAMFPDPYWEFIYTYESDINQDQIPWTIADYVTLLYMLTGDYPRYRDCPGCPDNFDPDRWPAMVTILDDGSGDALIALDSPQSIAGIHLTIKLNEAMARPLVADDAHGLTIRSVIKENLIEIVIVPDLNVADAFIPPGVHHIGRLRGLKAVDIEVVHIDLSNASGQTLAAEVAGNAVPRTAVLEQNFPNPLNSSTIIPYTMDDDGIARLEIFDVLGRRIQTLIDGWVVAGHHEAAWDGTDFRGRAAASGVYFYRLTTESASSSRSMLILK